MKLNRGYTTFSSLPLNSDDCVYYVNLIPWNQSKHKINGKMTVQNKLLSWKAMFPKETKKSFESKQLVKWLQNGSQFESDWRVNFGICPSSDVEQYDPPSECFLNSTIFELFTKNLHFDPYWLFLVQRPCFSMLQEIKTISLCKMT